MIIGEKQFNEKINKCHVPDINLDEVSKKAMLGDKNVDLIFVPYGIKRIGDWAFAHCIRLKEIWLPDTLKGFGKDVFLDDINLEKIVVYSKIKNESESHSKNSTELYDDKKEQMYFVNDDISELLAIAVKYFKNGEAYNFSRLIDDKWLEWFDTNLLAYIDEPDDSGFNPFLAGGEEDYEDPENDINYYKKKQREKKCGAILVRLKAAQKPTAAYIEKYKKFINAHKKETIMFMLDKKHESFSLLKIYTEYDFIEETDIPYLLESFSDEQYIDCKAYIIKYKDHNFGKKSIWDEFKL
ncbi:MAG: leucine-rich repeat protein [Lachnospiraceae bacterium]|nr:leucine-rich repeat protein [Lachnospiraceae bacterium]